jgi:L-fuculokinase
MNSFSFSDGAGVEPHAAVVAADRDCVMVLDVGKTRGKLLVIDRQGQVVDERSCDNASEPASLGYSALGVNRLRVWWLAAVQSLSAALRLRVGRLIVSTHGAAFCALGPAYEGAPNADEAWRHGGLALAPMDYEWDGLAALRLAERQDVDAFELTGSPQLPMGLNVGWQMRWLQSQHPRDWGRIEHWLPYPQYWAWWLCGVRASERSSLGCHTHLWSPWSDAISTWARTRGLLERLAPLRNAREVLGCLRPELAQITGLPAEVEVLCGLHDSNACLARYEGMGKGLTLISTGTWTVLMAPAGHASGLRESEDQLLNVSIDGEPVPTARFMGGREFAYLCAGAAPELASLDALEEVLAQEWWATPSFAEAGGPFMGRFGQIWQRWTAPTSVSLQRWAQVPAAIRATLASLYVAQVTALLTDKLGGDGPVVIEGPQVRNPVILAVLAALLAPRFVLRSVDSLEGTARGAWRVACSDGFALKEPSPFPHPDALFSAAKVRSLSGATAERLQTLQRVWLASLNAAEVA